MKQAHIYLTPNEANPLGVIGEVPGENGQMIKGTELVDVIAQVAKFPDSKNLLVHCAGPGGDVNSGNQIHDYLEGLKAEGYTVDTTTDGDIGSILTKIYLVGQNRTITDGHKFYVHAPWVPHMEGNAGQIIQGLESLIADEQKLRDFYKQKTGISDAGLKGLMDGSSTDGTFITAEQAVTLKFATAKSPSRIKAYAQIQTNMAKENQTLGQKLDAIIALVSGKPAAKAMDLDAANGQKISVSTEDPNALVGTDATITAPDGSVTPAPDGETPLADGRILVVAGGKVTEVKPAPAAPAAAATPAPAATATPAPAAVPSAAEKALTDELAALKASYAALKEEQDNASKALDEFKATLTSGKSPVKGFNNTGTGATPDTKVHGISVAMQDLQNKRKQHLNSR